MSEPPVVEPAEGDDVHTAVAKRFGDGKAYGSGLEGSYEGLLRAAHAGDATSVRDAAAVFYRYAMGLAAVMDQVSGKVPPPWSVPDEPEGFPPTPINPLGRPADDSPHGRSR